MPVVSAFAWLGLACTIDQPTPTVSLPEPPPSPSPERDAAPEPDPGTGLSWRLPADLPPDPDQAAAVQFAWESFVALNWPAREGVRGEPDTDKTIGAPGPTVWETWKHPDEVFLPDGGTPPPWGTWGGTLPPECVASGATSTRQVLLRVSKAPRDGRSAVWRDQQAVGGTVTDQHGNLARYEITFNEDTFDYIVNNTLFNVQGQAEFVEAGGTYAFPRGTVETKAAWRMMTDADGPEIRARYHLRDAWVYTPPMGNEPATCEKSTLGLVGLHISHKTPSRPQWTWATFEQTDNVPPFDDPTKPGEVPYSFNDPTCLPVDCPPNQSTERNGEPTGKPTQVTRQVDIGDEAKKANPVWQQRLAAAARASPWQHYELVEIQWPRRPDNVPFGDITPLKSQNVTMETYVPDSSCAGCHYAARDFHNERPSDYSYLLAEAHPVPTGGAL